MVYFLLAGTLRKGSAKKTDHNNMCHAFWWHAATKGVGVFIERVESKLNIADDPSRSQWSSMRALKAEWVEPCLPEHDWVRVLWKEQTTCQSGDIVAGQSLRKAYD